MIANKKAFVNVENVSNLLFKLKNYKNVNTSANYGM